MTAYNAEHPYEPDWQIPRGVWANLVEAVWDEVLISSPRLPLVAPLTFLAGLVGLLFSVWSLTRTL